MAERQQQLGRIPEQPQQLSLTDRLILTYQSRQDFAQAENLASNLEGDLRDSAFRAIASAKARSGINPQESFDAAGYGPITPNTNPKIALIYAQYGNFEPSQIVTDFHHASKYGPSYMDIAKEKNRQNQDPKPELARARQAIEDHDEKHGIKSIDEWADLASVTFQTTGDYPSEILAIAERNLEDLAQRYQNDRVYLPKHYSELAKAYATCGYFEKAFQLVGQIRDHTPEEEAITKTDTLKHIANEQLERLEFDETIKTAQLAMDTIMNTPQRPSHLISLLEHYQQTEQVDINIIIAKALIHSGQDATATMQLIRQQIDVITQGSFRSRALAAYAEVEMVAGIDPTETFKKATQTVDSISNYPDYDAWDLADQTLGYQDLGKKLAELGHINLARSILERISDLDLGQDNVGNPDLFRVELSVSILAEIAAAESRIGLRQEEIERLSPADIQIILSSGIPTAAEAIAYFGLTKSP